MLDGFGFKIPYHLVKTIIQYEPTILFPSYVVNYLWFGPEVIHIVWQRICLIYFRFSTVSLKLWERWFRGRVNRQEQKCDFPLFSLSKVYSSISNRNETSGTKQPVQFHVCVLRLSVKWRKKCCWCAGLATMKYGSCWVQWQSSHSL